MKQMPHLTLVTN